MPPYTIYHLVEDEGWVQLDNDEGPEGTVRTVVVWERKNHRGDGPFISRDPQIRARAECPDKDRLNRSIQRFGGLPPD